MKKYFFIYNSPDSTSIKEMSLKEAKAEYLSYDVDEDDETTYAILEHPADKPITLSFGSDINSIYGKLIAAKGGGLDTLD